VIIGAIIISINKGGVQMNSQTAEIFIKNLFRDI